MSKENKIITVFDSRIAKATYSNLLYYRTSNIYVPPGCVALVEFIAHYEYLTQMTFTAVRTPNASPMAECFEDNGCIGKRYRRWKCCQSLGEDVEGTKYDDWNKSIVRWGWDKFTEEIVEFEWIDRPGHYHLTTLKCNAEPIEDCEFPTIIEVSIMPAIQAIQLGYDCYKSCPADE